MLETSNLNFSYESNTTFSFPDLNLQEGEHLVILGESGIGKTTLLHLLAGLQRPHEGKVIVRSTDLSSLKARELDHFRGKNIGIVFQKPFFIQALTVMQNLLMIQKLSGSKKDQKRIETVLNEVGLMEKAHKYPKLLSEGEQQRVSIAMAVINRPNLILADEPTSSLDDTNTERVLQLLIQEADRNKANLVLITHDHRVKKAFDNYVQL